MDAVGLAAYGMDSHNCRRLVVDGMVKNEGDVQEHGFSPYPISYRSIVPKKTECTNLFVPFCLSAMGVCGPEEVAKTGVPPWFQLYMLKDRGYMRELLSRAKELGCPVLLFTVDLPTPGARYRDVRSGFTGSSGISSCEASVLTVPMRPLTTPCWTSIVR